MVAEREGALSRWWPTTQSMDLIQAPAAAAAGALGAELRRIVHPEPLLVEERRFPDLDAAFSSVVRFTNVPTTYLVLPTASSWSVVWNNCFLCDGHDSLCWCLTAHQGLRSVHWSAHDQTTTFQPGAVFTHREQVRGAVVERSVYCGREDRKWVFRVAGEPLPDEDVAAYQAPRKQDRFNESRVSALLARLGAEPWRESFYTLPEQACWVISRPRPPSTVSVRARSAIVSAGQA